MKGTIKWFSNSKGYGVITRDDGVDYFIHHSNIVKNGFKTLHDGDIVSFEASRIDGTRIQAVNVKPILTKEMIENVLKENNLYLQTIRDIYTTMNIYGHLDMEHKRILGNGLNGLLDK